RAGVEPGEAAAERLDMGRALLQVPAVDVGDLELAAGRGRDRARDLDDAAVVEVKPGHRPVRARALRLLLDGERLALVVQLDDAVARRIAYRGREDRRAFGPRRGLLEQRREPAAMEEIVAEHERDAVAGDEIAP